MAIKVFIRRKYPKEKERELKAHIRKIRKKVPEQPGYISSEYLKAIDDSNEILTISSWFSLEDWLAWFESNERKEIQADIDAMGDIVSQYAIYRGMKTC